MFVNAIGIRARWVGVLPHHFSVIIQGELSEVRIATCPLHPTIKLLLLSHCFSKGTYGYFSVNTSRSFSSGPSTMPALMDPPACKNASSLHRQRRTVPVVPIIPRKLEKKPNHVVYRPSNSNSPAVKNNELELTRQVSQTRRGSPVDTPAIEQNKSDKLVGDLTSSHQEDGSLENGSRGESQYFRI